jgi:hypothetical protein
MSSTAAHSAMAAEAIAVQRLWYTKIPNTAVCMFLIFSSKVLGYGIASLMRKIIVYPTKVKSFRKVWEEGMLIRVVLLHCELADYVTVGDTSSKKASGDKTTAQGLLLGICAYFCVGRCA